MSDTQLIESTKTYVQRLLAVDSTGHDWFHVYRVWKLARYMASEEKANVLIVELAALLHDIADWKFHDGDLNAGPSLARQWLVSLDVDKSIINSVCDIIATTSFQGAHVETRVATLEGRIVQDADRLDALGAIGVARTFTYGGYAKRPMHNPDIPPTLHESFDDYRKKQTTTINHFYEKLLLLKDKMNTPTGLRLAEERHNYIVEFLNQFKHEWGVSY